MFEQAISKVRKRTPLVHNITNYVTVNDCANILLAVGGSPIMSDELKDVEDIVSICNALVINIGTLNERTVESMLAAGKRANALGIPVILDPVGNGASKYRTAVTNRLLTEVKFAVVRGNVSEIKMAYSGVASTRGVDAGLTDADSLDKQMAMAKALADKLDCVVAITGATDIIADRSTVYLIRNGHPMMGRITGTGCMCTCVIGAFCGAGSQPLEDTACAVAAMGICGEIAAENSQGTGGFRVALMDAMSNLQDEILIKRQKIERK